MTYDLPSLKLTTQDFYRRSVKPTDAVGSVGCKRPLTLIENILTYGFWWCFTDL